MKLLDFVASSDWPVTYYIDGEECDATEPFDRVEIWIVRGTQYVFAGADAATWYLGEFETLSDFTIDPAFSCDTPLTWPVLFAVARKHYVIGHETVHPKLLEVVARSDATREGVAVTPPGADTPDIRTWMLDTARARGWTALRWEEAVDDHGRPMGRLTGCKKPLAPSQSMC